MATTILKADQTASTVLGRDWFGQYQIGCMVYGSTPVILQWRNPDHPTRGTTWINAKFNGADIMFEEAGAALDFIFTKNFEYRFITATAGAEIDLDKHDPSGG